MVKIDIFLVNKRWYLWQRIRSRKILKRFLVLQQKINTWNLEAVHKSLPAPSWNFRNSWIIHYTNIWSWFFLPIFLLFFLVVWIILENIAELKRKITYPHFEGPLWPSVCLSSDWGTVRRCRSFKLVQLPLATCNQSMQNLKYYIYM